MSITASMVKELRDSTGAGMMDAKKALTETSGDMEAAVDWLRTKGLAKAAKKVEVMSAPDVSTEATVSAEAPEGAVVQKPASIDDEANVGKKVLEKAENLKVEKEDKAKKGKKDSKPKKAASKKITEKNIKKEDTK